MSVFVVDASVLIKTVVEEEGSSEATALLREHSIVAPDLVLAECANVLWKKVRLGEFTPQEATLAAQVLQRADMAIAATRTLLGAIIEFALELDHPAYDCVYLALARERGATLVTADDRLISKLEDAGRRYSRLAVPLK